MSGTPKHNSLSTMPTLVNRPSHSDTPMENMEEDGSITILEEEEEDHHNPGLPREIGGEMPPIMTPKHNRKDKSVTFEENSILCSTSKPASEYFARRRQRRDTLDSNVSISLSYEDRNEENIDNNIRQPTRRSVSNWKPPEYSCPNRNKYEAKYQQYVKGSIATFESKYPGKLRDYKSMSPEEKSREQQRVLSLLSRLGISRQTQRLSSVVARHGRETSTPPFEPATPEPPRDRILDETLSPVFSPETPGSHRLSTRNQVDHHMSPERGEDTVPNISGVDKSELLLSMDASQQDSPGDDHGNCDTSATLSPSAHGPSGDIEMSVEFPAEDDGSDVSSVEIPRRAAVERDSDDLDDNDSYGTPEDQLIQKNSSKRQASASGKRGMDAQRMRHSREDDDSMDISKRLGRLSISPHRESPPPGDLFAASQSPITPRLTYYTPADANDNDESNSGADNSPGDNRVSWGRTSDVTMDALDTGTPPKRYQGKGRAIREVPQNVTLKEGATFHLDKLDVKHTEAATQSKTNSRPPRSKRAVAPQRRRLVNFPDPLVSYGSRQRRALKEVYSLIRRTESETSRAEDSVAGAYFSLTEQQIVDISLKLFMNDLNERDTSKDKRSSILRGKTLVVVRSKENAAVWERSLREKTGCSLINHATLPLSERIRSSSADKLREYDVVVTTYDAMKSPDVTIPLTDEGYAILTNPNASKSWHTSRTPSQQENSAPQSTKQLSILHRIHFQRIIFVDVLGRKCFLAKGGTARSAAAVALNGSSRIAFFQETEVDGGNPLRNLRKSDKRAMHSVSCALRLTRGSHSRDDESSEDEDDENDSFQNPLDAIAIDFKDLS